MREPASAGFCFVKEIVVFVVIVRERHAYGNDEEKTEAQRS